MRVTVNKVGGKLAGLARWFITQWKERPLFSTGLILLLMILLQTLALGFNYPTVGAWLWAWIRNWTNILRNNANEGIIALGMAFVIISGGIDLAVGSTFVAVGAFLMVLIDGQKTAFLTGLGITGAPAFAIGITAALILGVLLGEFTGAIIARGKLPPFIATLGTMMIFRSVTQHVMQKYTGMAIPAAFETIANRRIGGLQFMPIIYWLVTAVILHFVSTRTVFGKHVYAIGSNAKTANLSGINVARVKRRVYVLMGFLVSIAAIIHVSRMASMDYASSGSGYEMDAIAATIVGGVSMSGGKGSIIGTVFGMMIIVVMNNLLNLWKVPPFLQDASKGVIIIAAVLLQKKEKTA